MQGCDHVFHLAGLTTAFRRRTLMRINRWGTRHVAQACARQSSPPRLVYVSSVAAAGPARRHQLRTVQDCPQPVSHYGLSKLAGEFELQQVAARVPSTIVRPGMVFGPAGREMLPIFQCIDRLHMHAVPGYHTPPLSIIYVHDLIDLLLAAAQHGKCLPATVTEGQASALRGQGIYFACRPEYPDYFRLGRLIQQSLARRYVAFLLVPPPLPWLVGAAGQLLSLVTSSVSSLTIDKIREALAPSWACCGATARDELGYEPSCSLLEQLRETAQWYRDHGWL